MTFNRAFGKALREQRLQHQFSQDALAFEAGLDRTYISLLELGHRSPTLDTMMALCAALHIKLSLLAIRIEEIIEANDR